MEGQTTTFYLNITKNSTYINNVYATFFWNESQYNLTGTTTTSLVEFSQAITVPLLSTGTNAANITWSWNYTIDAATENISVNISSNQSISKRNIDNCSTYTTVAMNFSLYNETSETLVTGDMSGYFEVIIGGVEIPFNLTWSNVTSGNICISPVWASYQINGQLEYTATGFNDETYYLSDATIDNSTEFIDLYLTDGATIVTFTVTDQDDNVVPDVLIHILSYDFGTNSHTTTEIINTDSQGEALGNIVLSTQWYKFLLVYDGSIVLETEPVKITGTSRNFRINLQTDFFDFFETFDNMQTSLTFTNATRNFAYTFLSTTGTSVTACLKVIQRTAADDLLVNDTCVTAASGTILVNVGAEDEVDGKTFIATGRIEVNPTWISDVFEKTFGVDLGDKIGADGILATLFLRLALSCIGIWNPMVAIIFLLLADITMVVMGIYKMSWIALISYIILGILAIYRVNRKS